MTIASQALTQQQLTQYGKQLTKLREHIRAQAAIMTSNNVNISDEDVIDRTNAFSARMQRGYFHKRVIHPISADDNDGSTVPLPSKRMSKRMPPKPNEVISICYEVLV